MAKKIAGVDLKWWVIGGVGSAAIVWYVYKKQAASTAAIPADTSTDPNLSGYGDYSSADGGAYGSNYSTPTNYGYYDQATGQFVGLGGTTVVAGPSTNSAWVQAAAAYLINQGYDPITVIAALGKYVSSQGLTALSQTEYNIVTAAIGIEGQPPETIAPPHLESNTGQTTPTTVPAKPRAGKVGNNITWSPVIGATHYHIRDVAGGWAHDAGPTVFIITAPRKGSYTVSAVNAKGSSAPSNVVKF